MIHENEITEAEMTEDQTDETSGMDDTEGDFGDEVGGGEDGDEDGGTVYHGEIITGREGDHAVPVNGHDDIDKFYASLGDEVAAELRSAAIDAKTKMYDAKENMVEAGRLLNRARSLLPHGQFTKWLKIEFGATDRTARNFMALATSADTARQIAGVGAESKILQLPQTVAYKLGAENLPDKDRADIIEAYDSGDIKDESELVEAINDAKEAERKRREGKKAAEPKAPKADSDGEDDGDNLTAAERKKLRADAIRRASAWSLAVGLIASEEEGGGIVASDVVSKYSEIVRKGVSAAEDHTMISKMIFDVSKAYSKGGMSAVNDLKPEVPEMPVSKSAAKKGKKTGEGDD